MLTPKFFQRSQLPMIFGIHHPALARLRQWLGRRKAWCAQLRAAPWRWYLPGSGHSRLRTALKEVEAVAMDLQETSAALEERFLETANVLMELDANGNHFVRHSEKLVNVATGRAGGSEVFFSAMQVLEPPLTYLNASHAEMNRLLERLKNDNDRIAVLLQGREELQRTMAPLKYIQTSFRIESAPLGAEVQLMFTALTQEIEKLHSQVCELFSTKYEELRHIQDTINEVIRRLQQQTDNVWNHIAREKKQIDATLAQLQRELLDNQKRESSITNLSGSLARDIQQVVIGLQFQDIISQRLQHTTKALHEIRARFDGTHPSVAFMEQACRLQAEQIRSVRHDLAGAERSVKTGVNNVLAQIAEADTKCVSLREFDHLTTSSNGMVQVLLDVFATLQKQIAATVAGCASAYEILRPIGSAASDLTQVVNELSQRIHLIGLNAQVQAAQVTDGMGLEVLSARTSEISRETNRISETMAGELDHLVAGLTESLHALETFHTQASAQNTTLTQKAGDCERQLHELRDKALGSLVDVHDLLNGIRHQGEQVIRTANYIATADTALGNLHEKLSALANLAARMLGKNYRADPNLLAQFKADYTMASERQVFAQTQHSPSATQAAAPPPPADVELFDPPAPGNSTGESQPAARTTNSAAANTREPAGVELF